MAQFSRNPNLQKRPPGKFASTSITNELVDAINGNGNGIDHGPVDEIVHPIGGFWAKIVRTGPNGDEDDFSDDRYWVKAVRIHNNQTDPQDASVDFEEIENEEDQEYDIEVASNLAETISRGHMLPYGMIVWVTILYDVGTPQTARYIFSVGTPEAWIKITGAGVVSGKTNVWYYTWSQVQYLRTGQWQEFPAGLTDADPDYGGKAYNTIEANNGASGILGNSINTAALPTGGAVVPVRGTPIVRAYRVFTCDDPPVGEWVFSYENAIQVSCPDPG